MDLDSAPELLSKVESLEQQAQNRSLDEKSMDQLRALDKEIRILAQRIVWQGGDQQTQNLEKISEILGRFVLPTLQNRPVNFKLKIDEKSDLRIFSDPPNPSAELVICTALQVSAITERQLINENCTPQITKRSKALLIGFNAAETPLMQAMDSHDSEETIMSKIEQWQQSDKTDEWIMKQLEGDLWDFHVLNHRAKKRHSKKVRAQQISLPAHQLVLCSAVHGKEAVNGKQALFGTEGNLFSAQEVFDADFPVSELEQLVRQRVFSDSLLGREKVLSAAAKTGLQLQ